ncbi:MULTISPECIES: bifunctional proline dehydrogenase/L-glutamate gamma-semialdehyde dehydrogenase PutA [Bradyrhizobium]|jgi:RHH-type proline utilization regulon transcriptional repressor/proline dehydrogenase/delta 1-pyrroline-5-carboxylate dehydrogenase|uniref:Bifunctional protein PutA n=2 Tax=Bradyrhizobium TaxID=374 RepID=A0ABY0PZE6_9BRAD|nr:MULTISPECIES: bifunctional proline dehydrogenase/L-glutamate gamma-semialdehyde dehydrogenase PutA [Bradyrhizobium]SDJ21269.1 L-proline dehydrogenase /delta-1-pyrroline-5-carboxylate dehydrogenase [Bradyrhizobium ottawaense]SEC80735.1 L-proline dehydrogenase /delta-1-pyrroline-5-carboxylate dehydrogenase [Bradyrhizobium lablabi]SHK91631.1 L-proline dehydrogenase /delta-1-pyrroline-5-carboxylate dehydrogenase [Bradyrhizobium lablabi]
MPNDQSPLPPFSAPYAPDDRTIAAGLLETARFDAAGEQRVDHTATRLIEAIRANDDPLGGVEDMLREFALSTKEGLALMVLAEALLRVPDARTADQFIEDKLGQGDFVHHETRSSAFLVNASAWALGMSARVIQPGETPQGTIGRLTKRLGAPAVRAATRQAMRLMGNHFVLGETIEAALARAQPHSSRHRRYSFDMLGEGARTAADAARYQNSYASAIEAIGRMVGEGSLPDRPGISVKLSALHPRFEAVSRARVITELVPRLIDLARQAKAHDLNFTVDAEEADRLELSLDVITAAFRDPSLAGWDGFGLAIQAYQKRASAAIGYVDDLARRLNRRMMVRLVKGAYWDTEIKRAQERGLDGYPVFTRKAMTDLNYVGCARQLLALRPRLFPQFATHNALTVATVLELAGGESGFEFQRLHGMGEALYAKLAEDRPEIACRTYAPVGSHRDLLAYLVRRLLENGANSSFVALAADEAVPVTALLRRPADIIGSADHAGHPNIPLPRDLYRPRRTNSRGLEFGERAALDALVAAVAAEPLPAAARGVDATPEEANAAISAARVGFENWSRTPAGTRASALERAADLLEQRAAHFMALLQREGGKTLDDAQSEVREAVDFCRYYAAEGRGQFGDSKAMPGPTGESNVLRLRGRGVFAAISPWNFPLAIFSGQIAAALMAGNAVVAKPAEQTPLIAAEAVSLLHEAGVPSSALHLVQGDGRIGAALVAHADIAGVVFTGSTEVARTINRALAAKDGPIVPLIAETGGINAMIVDATALPEQVADDVVTSAFRSAGQRCSALRLLFLQDDVADRMIEMIAGAAHELRIGDPGDPATHIGPVIDVEAKQRLDAHIARMKTEARTHFAGIAPPGNYVAPHIFELSDADQLTEEIFGPVLHVVRYRADRLDQILQSIERSGFGLTLGIHSRIDDMVEAVIDRLSVGNIYVNRNMIGAVVGVQPFGGHGLSGTGPKAGGPHYLARFATEQTVTINTAAAGGNAALLAGGE